MTIEQYPCGEYFVKENFDIRRQELGIEQRHYANIVNNNDLIRLLIDLDALNYNGFKIDLILTYMYYSRCDKEINHCPITAKTIFGLIPDYVNSITTINLHNPATIGYFKCPRVHNVGYNELWQEHIKSLINDNSLLVAPDFGSGKELIKLAEDLKVPYAIGLKQHTQTDNRLVDFVGDVKGKDCIICDDIIDTGKTLKNIIEKLRENGAKSITGCITHAVLSSLEAIPLFDKLYLGNTIPQKNENVENVEILEFDKQKWQFIIKMLKK
jgi:ribose-phosphate pyrophosphokinase